MGDFANSCWAGVQSVSPGPPVPALLDADNGLSASTVTPDTVVLGQDLGQAGNPAAFLSDRELPLSGFVLYNTNGVWLIQDTAGSEIATFDPALLMGGQQFSLVSLTDLFIRWFSESTVNLSMPAGTPIARNWTFVNSANEGVITYDGATSFVQYPSGNAQVSPAGPQFDNGAEFQVFGTATFALLTAPNANSFVVSGSNDRSKVFTNEGAAAGIVATLPTAIPNLTYTFYVQDLDGITITAGAGDTIRIDSLVTAAGGSVNSVAIGSSVTLQCINNTEWVAIAALGTWT